METHEAVRLKRRDLLASTSIIATCNIRRKLVITEAVLIKGTVPCLLKLFYYCIYDSEILHTNRKRNSKTYLFVPIFRCFFRVSQKLEISVNFDGRAMRFSALQSAGFALQLSESRFLNFDFGFEFFENCENFVKFCKKTCGKKF